MRKWVVVAYAAVEEATANSVGLYVSVAPPCTESRANGVEEETPTEPVKLFVPLQVLLEVVPNAKESVSSVKTMGYVTARLVSAEMSSPETSADPPVEHVAAYSAKTPFAFVRRRAEVKVGTAKVPIEEDALLNQPKDEEAFEIIPPVLKVWSPVQMGAIARSIVMLPEAAPKPSAA